MGTVLYESAFILVILTCFAAICAAVLFILGFLRYMRYYCAIYKHPDIFGDPVMIPWEQKELIIEGMYKRAEMALRHLHPDGKQHFELTIYNSEGEKAKLIGKQESGK